ncbi:N-6 DNA methylase [Caldalkalibacillus thermarum TA2.A1]|uniref:Class I SAM-dependent methyltransferase n=1 Tax=Caldalkalibacillus thermarum (strain TA2.A1) TaxID=986075 RepID=F5L674_CALTT|nr:class I SAM-dependent methyltransferase [Caldalkalibacillus thermarum]EGL83174.1 N-6 DNA methylase [Caldalkalibacillus thermarum TA2.A1]QZT35101.1 class I SAM-dependent methyltransferase [Caldalkalibacillus thermarum TA2.A1]
MSKKANTELLFELLDQGSQLLKQTKGKPYLEALIDTGESFFQGELVTDAEEETAGKLADLIHQFNRHNFGREEIRRAFQLATLKGMKEGALPPGAGVTPDAVALFMAHLAKLFCSRLAQHPQLVVDLACGPGNLLTCVLNHLPGQPQGVGVEFDPLLIRLAYINANLQEHAIEFFRQDALKPVYFSRVNLVVCDLPVGIYPDRDNAKRYELYAEDQDSYAHQLFIEQAIHVAEEGAYLIFLIPNQLFTEPGAPRLRELITKETHIQALLQLPDSLFQSGSIHKSIFILQKKGDAVQPPRQTLLAKLPSFTNKQKLSQVWAQIEEWIEVNKPCQK